MSARNLNAYLGLAALGAAIGLYIFIRVQTHLGTLERDRLLQELQTTRNHQEGVSLASRLLIEFPDAQPPREFLLNATLAPGREFLLKGLDPWLSTPPADLPQLDPPLRLLAARYYLGNEQIERALSLLSELDQHQPLAPNDLRRLLECHLQTDQPLQALEVLARLDVLAPKARLDVLQSLGHDSHLARTVAAEACLDAFDQPNPAEHALAVLAHVVPADPHLAALLLGTTLSDLNDPRLHTLRRDVALTQAEAIADALRLDLTRPALPSPQHLPNLRDPWGFRWSLSPARDALRSFGQDGRPGGDGADADLLLPIWPPEPEPGTEPDQPDAPDAPLDDPQIPPGADGADPPAPPAPDED